MQALFGARLHRLFRSTPALWIVGLLLAFVPALSVLIEPGPLDAATLSSGYVFLPAGTALLCAAYDSVTFEGGEPRNCIPVGRTRLQAYLASLGALAVGVLVLFAAHYSPLAVRGAMWGWDCAPAEAATIMAAAVCCALAMLCVFHAVCMLCARPLAMVFAVMAVFAALLVASRGILGMVAQSELAPVYEYNEQTGVETMLGTQPNPRYPGAEAQAALLVWARAIPTTLMFWSGRADVSYFLWSAADAGAATFLGFLAFRRRNLA